MRTILPERSDHHRAKKETGLMCNSSSQLEGACQLVNLEKTPGNSTERTRTLLYLIYYAYYNKH